MLFFFINTLAFEAAMDNFKLRKRTGYFDLLRRLAAIAKDNDDYKRAQVYFKELLEMYGKENKINEVIYNILELKNRLNMYPK